MADPTNVPVSDAADNNEPASGATDTQSTNQPNNADANADGNVKAPKWDGEFDPDRAARLVANLRSEIDEVRARLRESEAAERAALDRAEKAQRELIEARKTMALRAFNLPASLAKALDGETEVELEASAKALAEELGLVKRADDDLSGRPKRRLVPGHAPDGDSDDFDPRAVIRKARGY